MWTPQGRSGLSASRGCSAVCPSSRKSNEWLKGSAAIKSNCHTLVCLFARLMKRMMKRHSQLIEKMENIEGERAKTWVRECRGRSWEATDEKKKEGREVEKREESWSLVEGCVCGQMWMFQTAPALLSSFVLSDLLWESVLQIHGKMYERHKRRYSFCSKGQRAVDVVLIKVGYSGLSEKVSCAANATVATPWGCEPCTSERSLSHRHWREMKQIEVKET